MIDTPKPRRFYAAGLRLPSGTYIRPAPMGAHGYKATIGQNEVRGLGVRKFWENVGRLFRNRAAWAHRNHRPAAAVAELMLDVFAAEDHAESMERQNVSRKV